MKNENVAPKNKAEFLSLIKDGTIIDWTLDYSVDSAKRLVVVFADGKVMPGLKGQMAYNCHKNGSPTRKLGGQRLDQDGNEIPTNQPRGINMKKFFTIQAVVISKDTGTRLEFADDEATIVKAEGWYFFCIKWGDEELFSDHGARTKSGLLLDAKDAVLKFYD